MSWRLLLCLVLLSGCVADPAKPSPSRSASEPPVQELGAWRAHASDPLPRYELAVAQAGPRVFVIGGLRAVAVMSSTVEVYDARADTWSLAPEYPGPVHHHAAVATPDGTVYSFGGWIGIGQSASDLAFKLSPGASAWTPIRNMPQPRGGHAAVLVDGKVWLVGGTGLDGSMVRRVEIYDPAKDNYEGETPLPTPRDHLAAVVLDNELWVLGGREKTLTTTSAEVQVYNLTMKSWRAGPELSMRRAGFAAAVMEGRIYAFGGEDADQPRLKDQAEVFDPALGNWSRIPSMMRPRTGLGGAVWDGRVYAIGGADPSGLPGSDAPESFGPAR